MGNKPAWLLVEPFAMSSNVVSLSACGACVVIRSSCTLVRTLSPPSSRRIGSSKNIRELSQAGAGDPTDLRNTARSRTGEAGFSGRGASLDSPNSRASSPPSAQDTKEGHKATRMRLVFAAKFFANLVWTTSSRVLPRHSDFLTSY
jgi:hypothetical protein